MQSSPLPFFGLTRRIVILDAETCSDIDLKKRGSDWYWASSRTRTLIVGARDASAGETFDWQIHRERCPAVLAQVAAEPPEVSMFAAFNAAFDHRALEKAGLPTPPEKWLDLMLLSYLLAFSGTLDDVLTQFEVTDIQGRRLQKSADGKALINIFSKLQTPWFYEPEKWSRFVNYCRQDVDVEYYLFLKLAKVLNQPFFWPQVQEAHRHWLMDHRMNQRGMPIDERMVAGALSVKDQETKRLVDRMRDLTGLANPNSVQQIGRWLADQGCPLPDLQAATVREALDTQEPGSAVHEVLSARVEIGKASVKKFDALARMTVGGRIRNGTTTYGASRTGRTASRGINLANLERPKFKRQPGQTDEGVVRDMEFAADLIALGSNTVLDTWRPASARKLSIMGMLGSSVRSAIAAPPGYGITAIDLKSIESVGLAWLAGCDTILDLFHHGRDTYKEFATRYYGVPYEEVTSEQRGFCKPPVLGCLGGATPVQTQRGWVPITQVRLTDVLWDGKEWVSHGGVIDQGIKTVLCKCGIAATPDHKFLIGNQWLPWWWVLTNDMPGTEVMMSTYDILDAGPRNRFTVLTDAGPLIAHNCGYGASGPALVVYAKGMGVELTEEVSAEMVSVFRTAYPEIPAYWRTVDAAAKAAVRAPGTPQHAYPAGRNYPVVTYYYDGLFLHCRLPSRRTLFYYKPAIERRVIPRKDGTTFEVESLCYWGKDQGDNGRWAWLSTHGGKIAENCTQAVCRDILYHALELIDQDPDIELIGSTYDEAITLTPTDHRADAVWERLHQYMTTKPDWLDERFFLGADGYLNAKRYRK